jgi:hypothetical protein
MSSSRSKGSILSNFEESVWKRDDGGKYAKDIYVLAHVDDCLIPCKSKDIMASLCGHYGHMTRPDLAFACSQLSKFVQYPGVVHL